MLDIMKSEPNKGGRPRKDSTDRKVHRVQVAMSDVELAFVKKLAALLEMSVSAAIASYAVPVSLRAKIIDTTSQRVLLALTAAAKQTAYQPDAPALSVDEGQHLLVVHFDGSKGAHRSLQTPTTRLYYEALSNYARRYAESMDFADSGSTQPGVQPIPYSAEKTVLLFSFASESRVSRLYKYLEPLDFTDESFAQPLQSVE